MVSKKRARKVRFLELIIFSISITIIGLYLNYKIFQPALPVKVTPLSGTIIQVNESTKAGVNVSPGQVLMNVADLKNLIVEAAVDEVAAASVKPGQLVVMPSLVRNSLVS